MTRKSHVLMAGVLLGLSLLLAIPLLLRANSPRAWIDSTYSQVSRNQATRSAVYTSGRSPSRVVDEITDRWEPYQRLNDPIGYFLRYSDLIVRVSARGGEGSRIQLEDDRRGYHLWGAFIIGSWGNFHGRGPGFRGGGPGAGK